MNAIGFVSFTHSLLFTYTWTRRKVALLSLVYSQDTTCKLLTSYTKSDDVAVRFVHNIVHAVSISHETNVAEYESCGIFDSQGSFLMTAFIEYNLMHTFCKFDQK